MEWVYLKKCPFFEPLAKKNKACAIVAQAFNGISFFINKKKHMPRERVLLQSVLHLEAK
jgi:hypothetical protein